MSNRKWAVGLGAVGLLGTVTLLGTGLAQTEPIKIGGAFNLTGSMSSIDAPANDGAKLAIKEINAAGGVLGRQLQYISYDGKTDAATTTNIAAQLISSDKVAAVVGFNDSDSVLAFGPTAQKAGIPFLTTGATSPNLPAQIGSSLFLVPFGDNVQAAVGAEFALKQLKAKTGYLLTDTSSEYTNLLAKFFKDAFVKGGGKLLLEDTYKAGDKNFSAQITKLRALRTKPDFLFVSALPDDIGTLVKQFRQAGVSQPIVGGDGYDTPLLLQVGGAAANNVYFTTHALMDATAGAPAVRNFMAAFKKEYGKDPDTVFALLGYDAVKLLADAIKRAGSTDPAKIREALGATRNFAAATGSISYLGGSRIPSKAVTVVAVKGGKLTLGGQFTPSYIPKP